MTTTPKCCGNCRWYVDGPIRVCQCPMPISVYYARWYSPLPSDGDTCPCHAPREEKTNAVPNQD